MIFYFNSIKSFSYQLTTINHVDDSLPIGTNTVALWQIAMQINLINQISKNSLRASSSIKSGFASFQDQHYHNIKGIFGITYYFTFAVKLCNWRKHSYWYCTNISNHFLNLWMRDYMLPVKSRKLHGEMLNDFNLFNNSLILF